MRRRRHAFEQTRFMHALKFDARFVFLVDRPDFDCGGMWSKGAHNEARAIPQNVHTKEFVG